MDLRHRFTGITSLILISTCPLFGAARLRLETTTLGPISVATGSNGPVQTVGALNLGDGSLNLKATSSATWLVASVKPLGSCNILGPCIPISIALNTAGLAAGSYTGAITLSDTNAIDAPQTISVAVAVGGGVPDSMTFYVPASGAAVSQTFTTSGRVTAVNPPTGGPSLAAAPPGLGNFSATPTYVVTAQAASGTAEHAYTGSITVSNSPVPSENKTVAVTINVTSQPIASPAPATLAIRIAQNAVKQTSYIAVNNLGAGAISITGVTGTAASAGTWLTAAPVSGYAGITADPTGLQVGTYTGSVDITTNAANSKITVPVSFEVLATGPALVRAGGVVNNSTFTGDTLALGDFPALFGEQLITGDPILSTNAPYPTDLGGAKVYINDQPAPLYYVSQTQINFLVPYEAKVGAGTLRVDRDGQRGNSVAIQIAPRSPSLLLAANQLGQRVSDALAGALIPVKTGDFITVYGFGFGSTLPAVATNSVTPSVAPFAIVPGVNTAHFGTVSPFFPSVSAPLVFIGLAPGYISAFYQINIQVPAGAPRGPAVPMFIDGEAGLTNTLLLSIQ